MGSVRCFNSNNTLAKYSDIIWRGNQTGEFSSKDTPLMKAENRYLRYYLIQTAGSVVRYCPEYEDYYNKKFAEVPKHQHKRILALNARKLIRLIFGLLDKNQLYSPAKSRKSYIESFFLRFRRRSISCTLFSLFSLKSSFNHLLTYHQITLCIF